MKKRRQRTKRFIIVALLTALLFINHDWQRISYAQSSLNALATCTKNPACLSLLRPNLAAPIVKVGSSASTMTIDVAATAVSSGAGKGYLAFVTGVFTSLTAILGVALWGDAQNDQARQKAMDKYCSANTSDALCGNGYRLGYYVNCDQGFITYADIPYYPDVRREDDPPETCPAPRYNIYESETDTSWNYRSYGTYTLEAVNRQPWADWPEAKRQQAVDLLTDSDYGEIAATSPEVGQLSPGDRASGVPIVVVPENGVDPYVSPEYKHPGDPNDNPDPNETPSDRDTDGDGIPDSEDTDDDGDGIADSEDPDDDGDGVPDNEDTEYPYQDPKIVPTLPDRFNKPNFYQYGIEKLSNKFPFDFFTGVPTGTVAECPQFTFFTRTAEICLIRDFLSALKWPALIGFAIWGIMEI